MGLTKNIDLVQAPKTIVSNITPVVKNQSFCLIKGGGLWEPTCARAPLLYGSFYMGASIWELLYGATVNTAHATVNIWEPLYGSLYMGASIWELLYGSFYI